MNSLNEIIKSIDPLSDENIVSLIEHREEDSLLDYKSTIDISSEKEWIGITKDLSAFANTFGGFLVFGVEDSTFDVVGLETHVSKFLADSNKIQDKVNRYLEPGITSIRSKEFLYGEKILVILFVPQTRNVTHVISNDGSFKYPTGNEKTLIRKGTMYVRRSAGNHLVDSRDLDGIVERRIDQFRESLIDKVAQIVNSPTDSKVVVLSKDNTEENVEKYIISNSPEAIPIKGQSFSVAPKSIEEEIAAHASLLENDSKHCPSEELVWKWYHNRNSLEITNEQKLAIFTFSLRLECPVFFWIKGLEAEQILESIINALRTSPRGNHLQKIIIVSMFLGKRAYSKAISTLGSYKEKLRHDLKKYPKKNLLGSFNTISQKRRQKYC